MSLVSYLTIEADYLDKLFYVSDKGEKIPIDLEHVYCKIRGTEPNTIARCTFSIVYQPKIRLLAQLYERKYELDIHLDKYKYRYNLRIIKKDDNELEVYDN